MTVPKLLASEPYGLHLFNLGDFELLKDRKELVAHMVATSAGTPLHDDFNVSLYLLLNGLHEFAKVIQRYIRVQHRRCFSHPLLND
mgnify:CR=1 FL=1